MLGSYALFVNDLFIEGLDLVKDKEIQAERESGYEQLDTVVRWRLKKDLEDATDLDFFGLTSYSSSHTRPLLSIICSNEGKINNKTLSLYEDDEEMSLLEGSLEDMGTGFFYKNRTNIDSIWEDLLNIFEDYLQ